ncbi:MULTISPECIES: DUF3185 family protein [Natronospira]|uniref:DUF3185 family protein n=1 Tax=Natronospira TaxID=2024969 RepID=UPI0035B50547
MNIRRLLGLVFLACAGTLLYFGYSTTQTPSVTIHETLVSRVFDPNHWYFLAGIGATIAGFLLLISRRRSRTANRLEFRAKFLP